MVFVKTIFELIAYKPNLIDTCLSKQRLQNQLANRELYDLIYTQRRDILQQQQ